ncbi:histidinol-phosphatase HisJ [Bacillus sp. FJAT-29790]|uniref:histidinol-phosphatase HisJ n=1 Tax=Bacillus sp. FJAT-29790 TaxID=1895002 RepID=UPI001C21F340|nr:histidinol-phosphatase HisJ [Bacillus sp. FJAT-29790]MBU8879741.1 histidinol-phosphatase HisJ [Bacillus sp. FJAT-29790]
MLKDGHIHTRFCPHGTQDALDGYVEKALSLGLKEISFTEHAPLPDGFIDPAPAKDSSMRMEELEIYFEEIARVKSVYTRKIKINTGLEVDFIEGFEQETENFLDQYGKHLDDAILSVHFLKYGGQYDCVDYSPDTFAKMIERYGTIEEIYRVYYQTLLHSIHSDLGPYKPKRIGHMTLVNKFQKRFPIKKDFSEEIMDVLSAIKTKGYEIDYNGAGYFKPLCKESYPPEWAAKEALNRGIPLVYGSDAHQIKDLGQGQNLMKYWREVL